MNEQPSFSIVIPTYNRAAFIPATLRTVLAQTYTKFEIIVVDNCSTDNTDEVLGPFIRAQQIKFIKHEQNFERARSRNTGMDAATGDYLTLLDSDDFMYPDNLADAAAYAGGHPEIKCFQNLFEYVDANRKVLRRYPMPSLANQVKAIANGNFMSCIGDFIHRDIYQKYRFDTSPELTGGEDWDFWLRVLADHKVGRIEKINSGILQHSGRSVNNQDVSSMQRGLEHLYRKLCQDPHLSSVYGPYLKQIRANSFLYLAILANTGGAFDQAKDFVRQSIAADTAQLFNPRLWRVARRAYLKLASS